MKSKIIYNYKVLNNSQVVDKNNYFLISMSQKYNNIQTRICTRGGDVLSLVSKRYIYKYLINT